MSTVAAARDQLTQIEYKRATHAVTEIERSIQSRDIIKEGKYREFGKLMTQSHYSLRYVVLNLFTSSMLCIVGERESVHAKLEAPTTPRYVQCLSHIIRKSPV